MKQDQSWELYSLLYTWRFTFHLVEIDTLTEKLN
jgi:hypothetical protein